KGPPVVSQSAHCPHEQWWKPEVEQRYRPNTAADLRIEHVIGEADWSSSSEQVCSEIDRPAGFRDREADGLHAAEEWMFEPQGRDRGKQGDVGKPEEIPPAILARIHRSDRCGKCGIEPLHPCRNSLPCDWPRVRIGARRLLHVYDPLHGRYLPTRTVVLAERGNVFATGPAPVERCETAII